ncbi:hypothetical protein CNR22_21535 [Sphingobacteriaceae bacterium]|nr:hypothetical protein CNR22_21535 [Sphingobacteriaceae bacterium]
MTRTFTLDLDFTATVNKKEQQNTFLDHAEPSERTLQNILNFSRNLEVKPSKLIHTIELLKS